MGSKSYLKNERESFQDDPSELNEIIRQFPFTEDEAFRDSIDGSLFNIGKIYQQIEHNDELFPAQLYRELCVATKDEEVVFSPDPNGRFKWLGCQTTSKQ